MPVFLHFELQISDRTKEPHSHQNEILYGICTAPRRNYHYIVDMKKKIILVMAFWMNLVGCAQGVEYRTQNNAEFAKTIAHPAAQLVDVRTAAEYAEGHLPGAANMDVQGADFDRQAARLDKEQPVAVYCRSGVRSRKAAARLAAQGYRVYNLDGGILGWNGPTTK